MNLSEVATINAIADQRNAEAVQRRQLVHQCDAFDPCVRCSTDRAYVRAARALARVEAARMGR